MTINLVPPQLKAKRQMEKIAGITFSALMVVLMILILVIATVFIAKFFIQRELADIEEKTGQQEMKALQYKEIEKQIEITNSKLSNINEVDGQRIIWSNIIGEIARLTPKNVQIQTLSLAGDSKKITFTGNAASRNEIAAFKDNLSSSKKFSAVTFTSSSFEEQSASYTFNMTCDIKELR